MIPGYMTSKDIADRLGVKPATVRQYKLRGYLPPPDETIGRSPVWKTEAIEAWIASRPGQDWRKSETDRE